MEPNSLADALKQVPWGAVCITLCFMFLRAYEKNEEKNRAMYKEFHQDHLEARRASANAIDNSASANVEIAKALTVLGESVKGYSITKHITPKQ